MDIITLIIINVFVSNAVADVIDENEITALDWKPLNCSKCLAFWLGLFTIPLIGIQALVISSACYMINKIINKY